jgi:adenine-specific DNA glycosylase
MWRVLPVKQPKRKPQVWALHWHVVTWGNKVAVVQRADQGVWAKMWVFPESAPASQFSNLGRLGEPVKHILTHKRIEASFQRWHAPDERSLVRYAQTLGGHMMTWDEFAARPRPRLLTKIWDDLLHNAGVAELP